MQSKILFLFFAIFFCACSPKYSSQLTLNQTETGKKITPIERIGLELKSVEVYPFELLVDLSIVNRSDLPIDIRPTVNYYSAFSKQNNKMADIYAYDPKELLLNLEDEIDSRAKHRRDLITAGWSLLGIAMASAIGAIDNNNVILEEIALISSPMGMESLNIASNVKSDVKKIKEERAFYAQHMIRPGIIEPSDSINGIMVFPRYDQAHKLNFLFTINDHHFRHSFQQSWQKAPKPSKKDDSKK